MKEELISFETARLAKKKGFNELCRNVYLEDKTIHEYAYYESSTDGQYDCNKDIDQYDNSVNKLKVLCSAPTQSLLQKWLREKHNIPVLVYQADPSRKTHGCSIKWFDKVYKEQICSGRSYEEALEKGLQEALNLIEDDF